MDRRSLTPQARTVVLIGWLLASPWQWLAAQGSAPHTAARASAAHGPFTPVPPVAFSPSIRRLPPDSLWQRVWLAGGDSTTDLFIEPRHVAVSGDLVLVLDVGTREVRALDARTGASRFLLRATGSGPGEFRRPSLLAATPDGFAVVDQANARLSVYDRTARFRWSAPIRDVFTMNGLCMGEGSHFLATLTRRDSSVVEADSLGRVVAVRSIPWQQLVRGAPGFAYTHFTSNAVSGRCVVAPIFGSEWALVPMHSGASRAVLLEPGPQPLVTVKTTVLERSPTQMVREQNQQSNTKQASRGALLIGDTAIVYASQTEKSPYKWLDYYRAASGEYLYSRRLPFIANAITIGRDGVLYATSIGESQSVVVAIKPAKK